MSIMFGRLGHRSIIIWFVEGGEALLWCSSKYLGSQRFDQRYSIYLIMKRVPLSIVLLRESAVDQHHERIVVQSYKAICSIWVDWLHYKWSFPFRLEFPFGLMCHNCNGPSLKNFHFHNHHWLSLIQAWDPSRYSTSISANISLLMASQHFHY